MNVPTNHLGSLLIDSDWLIWEEPKVLHLIRTLVRPTGRPCLKSRCTSGLDGLFCNVRLNLVEFSPCLTPDLLYQCLQGLGPGTYGVLKAPHVILMHQQD